MAPCLLRVERCQVCPPQAEQPVRLILQPRSHAEERGSAPPGGQQRSRGHTHTTPPNRPGEDPIARSPSNLFIEVQILFSKLNSTHRVEGGFKPVVFIPFWPPKPPAAPSVLSMTHFWEDPAGFDLHPDHLISHTLREPVCRYGFKTFFFFPKKNLNPLSNSGCLEHSWQCRSIPEAPPSLPPPQLSW